MTTPHTPAGWYADPDGAGGQRYWNGSGWTEHRSPAPPGAAGPEPVAATPAAAEPVATETFSSSAAEQPWFTEPTTRIETGRQPFAEPHVNRADDAHRHLVVRYTAVVGALLLFAVVIGAYAAFFREPPSSSLQFDAGTGETTSPSASATPKAGGGIGGIDGPAVPATQPEVSGAMPSGNADGPLTFTVTGVETGDTITSEEMGSSDLTAQGQFVVVRLQVQNTGAGPTTFLSTSQKLNAGGISYEPSSEATFYVSELYPEIAPGGTTEVAVAFDIPVDATPESVQLFGDPLSAGVVVPLA